MSIIVSQNTPTFALAVGTKKTPQNFALEMPCLSGVALTAGKAGREAKLAVKVDMPTQAANGGFHTFAGYLAATFPKAVSGYALRLKAQEESYVAMLTGETNEAIVASIEAKLEEIRKAQSPTNRAGFTVLVQTVLNWADQTATKPPKLTKAQIEGLDYLNKYVALIGERLAAAKAKQHEVAPL